MRGILRLVTDLSTSQAARLLGASRQHVADMCDDGRLVSYRVGAHRRIRHDSIDRLLNTRPGALDPSQLLALRLGRAAAARVAMNPELTFALARQTLAERWQKNPEAHSYISRWQEIIDQGPEAVMQLLTASGPAALSMQNMSPFIKTIPLAERAQISEAISREIRVGVASGARP